MKKIKIEKPMSEPQHNKVQKVNKTSVSPACTKPNLFGRASSAYLDSLLEGLANIVDFKNNILI